MFISYAQNLEDVMLYRVFRGQGDGFYIDVGAWHPESHSVTKLLYERGWSGINIEPSKPYFEMLNKRRTRDINLNIAVGTHSGITDFVEVHGSGLSSPRIESAVRAKRHGLSFRRCSVPVVSLQSICEQYCTGKRLSFIKIDVEGCEQDVIESLDWNVYRPVLVLVEAVEPGTWSPAWEAWEPILTAADYDCVWFDGLNRYYLSREHAALKRHFLLPPGIADNFVLEPNHPLCMSLGAKIRFTSRELLPSTLHHWLARVYDSWMKQLG